MFNETGSTKQDDVKDVAQDEPSIELEMYCQSEDNNTINHHTDEDPQQERRERRPPDRYGEWVYIAQEEDPVRSIVKSICNKMEEDNRNRVKIT